MSKFKKAQKALDALRKATEKHNRAIARFQSLYTPQAVGLAEWVEHNDDVLDELEQDIAETLDPEYDAG